MKILKPKSTMLALLLVLPAQHASADWIVDVYENIGPFSDIDVAIGVMESTTATTSGTFEVVNFTENVNHGGNFGGDSMFPGNPVDNFGVHVTGLISLLDGWNYFGINHDDGALLRLGGSFDLIDYPGPTAPRNSFGSEHVNWDQEVMVDLWLYENGGGASLEFFHSDASNGVGSLVSTVPEPGTLALLGIGLFGMGLSRRKKV